MSRKLRRWFRRIAVVLAVFVGIGLALNNYATPLQRNNIGVPVYTIGDENYAAALNEGKNIVKFGRLPFGIYPGGLAFNNRLDAREYLRRIGKEADWGVYQLSGDFELDTKLVNGQRCTTTSLLVIDGRNKDVGQSNTSDYQTFDQTSNAGWRRLTAAGKYSEAATMIDEHIKTNRNLPEQQTCALNFYAGQMYAYAGNIEPAKQRFQKSLAKTEPKNSPVMWNAYVKATIAFLEQDRDELERCRDAIATSPKIGNVVPNLDVVETLLDQLGQPYSTAYEAHRGMNKTSRMR